MADRLQEALAGGMTGYVPQNPGDRIAGDWWLPQTRSPDATANWTAHLISLYNRGVLHTPADVLQEAQTLRRMKPGLAPNLESDALRALGFGLTSTAPFYAPLSEMSKPPSG